MCRPSIIASTAVCSPRTRQAGEPSPRPLQDNSISAACCRERGRHRGRNSTQAVDRVTSSISRVRHFRLHVRRTIEEVLSSIMLVSTDTLASHLHDPGWIVFDCRHDLGDFEKGRRLYLESHVPGAHFAGVETDLSGPKTGRNGRHPLPDPNTFADFLARHGVSETSMIVAYDDVGGQYSARLWWMARWIGLGRVALLDGGFPKWVAEGRPVTADIPVPRPGMLRA